MLNLLRSFWNRCRRLFRRPSTPFFMEVRTHAPTTPATTGPQVEPTAPRSAVEPTATSEPVALAPRAPSQDAPTTPTAAVAPVTPDPVALLAARPRPRQVVAATTAPTAARPVSAAASAQAKDRGRARTGARVRRRMGFHSRGRRGRRDVLFPRRVARQSAEIFPLVAPTPWGRPRRL